MDYKKEVEELMKDNDIKPVKWEKNWRVVIHILCFEDKCVLDRQYWTLKDIGTDLNMRYGRIAELAPNGRTRPKKLNSKNTNNPTRWDSEFDPRIFIIENIKNKRYRKKGKYAVKDTTVSKYKPVKNHDLNDKYKDNYKRPKHVSGHGKVNYDKLDTKFFKCVNEPKVNKPKVNKPKPKRIYHKVEKVDTSIDISFFNYNHDDDDDDEQLLVMEEPPPPGL